MLDDAERIVSPPKRVAIIGTGMSGEVATYLLQNYSNHKVVRVYEAAPRPGLHVHSLAVDDVMVDVPLRAASPHYYPNLMKLYKHLNVPLQAVDYSSCGSQYRPNQSYFKYSNALVLGFAIPFVGVDAMGSWARLWTTMRIIFDLLWFVFSGPYYLCHDYETLSRTTLGSYLNTHNYSYAFVHMFLYPVMSTLLSCSYAQVDEYPAHFILEFFSARKTTIFTGWRRVTNDGISEVSAKLLSGVPKDTLRMNCKVQAVEADRDGAGVWVVDGDGKRDHYDIVIIATEPNIAAAIWKGQTPLEREVLSSMATYTANITVHRDPSFMPANKQHWCGLNFFSLGASSLAMPEDLRERFTASMTTANLRNFNKKLSSDVYETWNCYRQPAKELVIKDTTMTRSVWTVAAARAFADNLPKIQGKRGVYLVGSYCSPGVTLLEQAATSSMLVARSLGAKVPFKVSPTYESTWGTLILSHVLVLGRDALVAVLVFVFVTTGVWTLVKNLLTAVRGALGSTA